MKKTILGGFLGIAVGLCLVVACTQASEETLPSPSTVFYGTAPGRYGGHVYEFRLSDGTVCVSIENTVYGGSSPALSCDFSSRKQ